MDTETPSRPDNGHHLRWNPLHLLWRHPPEGDVLVRNWKEAWRKGAHARWSGISSSTNPYAAGTTRAAAWKAGWHWAERQPDRRKPNPVRFAHPRRRSTDTTARLIRSAQAGAVGLSLITLASWLWQMRRRTVP